MLAKHALYQLSYGPLAVIFDLCPSARGVTHKEKSVVGPGRLELPTSRLSGVCSNQLSYRPLKRSARRALDPVHAGPDGSRAGCAIAPRPSSGHGVYGKRNEDGGAPLPV